MTAIDCRYGKGANFELTKACLASHEAGSSSSLNFTRHFARLQPGGKVRSKQGERLPSETSPQYFWRHDAAWQLLHEKGQQAAASAPPQPAPSAASAHSSAPAPETPAPQVPEWSVALMSGALAIGVAIVAGLALGGGIKNVNLPHLGVAASGRLADGPIITAPSDLPAVLPATLSPLTADSPAVTERVAPPAEAANVPSSAPEHTKKKKHKKARAEKTNKPPRSNPFTGDQPAYSASVPAGTLSRVMHCNHIVSLIRHELCMWRACKNKWGRDGCPSYEQSGVGPSGQIAGIRR